MIYTTHYQDQVNKFMPDRPNDTRLMQIYVFIEEVYFDNINHPCYKILKAFGFEHLEGIIFWPNVTKLCEYRGQL